MVEGVGEEGVRVKGRYMVVVSSVFCVGEKGFFF